MVGKKKWVGTFRYDKGRNKELKKRMSKNKSRSLWKKI